ncbi:MAG TPA: Zn-dependent hydrolase [Patescibacteria group bacterium]|nr:Zn-dependent hydrolase [Patescibacteria group bacterium]
MVTFNKADENWILEQIDRMAQYGKNGDGVTRLAFSEADRLVREHVIRLMREIGLEVRIDAAGNIIGRLQGLQALAPVIIGSHSDTVPGSSKYDGALGIVGALAAINALRSGSVLTHPVEVVVFTAEESSRFNYATLGSKAMAGHINLHAWSKAKDKHGVLLSQAMLKSGLDLGKIAEASRVGEPIKAFIELCIDQGETLHDEEGRIGIVEISAAPTRIKMTIEGIAAHSNTPMDMRQDALVSAAMIVLAVQEIGMDNEYNGTLATVGNLQVHPGVINMISGKVELLVDIRGTDQDNIVAVLQDIKDSVSTIAEGQDTPVSIEVLSSEKPILMDAAINLLIEEFCKERSITFRRINSGTGHNSMNMSQLTPSGMILIPSHRESEPFVNEQVENEDIFTGVKVLMHVISELAK